MVEFGAFASETWMPASMTGQIPASDELVVGIVPKLTLRPASTGLGIAVNGLAGYGVDRGRLEYASLTGIVTLPATDSLNLNLNAGWGWNAAGTGHELFLGAQAEWTASSQFLFMAEGFTRDYGKPGGQLGARWMMPGGRVDLDLLAGRYVDSETPTSLTVGLTARW